MQRPRKMDGRKERRRGYGKRDSSPLDSPAGQTPVTAVHCCSDITALQHVQCTLLKRSVVCLVSWRSLQVFGVECGIY